MKKKILTPKRNLEKKKKVIEETIVATSDAVKKIDKEIKALLKDKNKKNASKKEIAEAIKRLDKEIVQIKKDEQARKPMEDKVNADKVNKERKKCRYFNYGYCKYKEKCRFLHPESICNLEGSCEGKGCPSRHPKACKWFGGETGCKRRENCQFSHDTLASDDQKRTAHKNIIQTFRCVSCESDWKEEII